MIQLKNLYSVKGEEPVIDLSSQELVTLQKDIKRNFGDIHLLVHPFFNLESLNERTERQELEAIIYKNGLMNLLFRIIRNNLPLIVLYDIPISDNGNSKSEDESLKYNESLIQELLAKSVESIPNTILPSIPTLDASPIPMRYADSVLNNRDRRELSYRTREKEWDLLRDILYGLSVKRVFISGQYHNPVKQHGCVTELNYRLNLRGMITDITNPVLNFPNS